MVFVLFWLISHGMCLLKYFEMVLAKWSSTYHEYKSSEYTYTKTSNVAQVTKNDVKLTSINDVVTTSPNWRQNFLQNYTLKRPEIDASPAGTRAKTTSLRRPFDVATSFLRRYDVTYWPSAGWETWPQNDVATTSLCRLGAGELALPIYCTSLVVKIEKGEFWHRRKGQ